jgi:hypothetical protein
MRASYRRAHYWEIKFPLFSAGSGRRKKTHGLQGWRKIRKNLFFRDVLRLRAPGGGKMCPLSGKRFRTGKERSRAIQAFGKGVAQEVDSRGGSAVGKELNGFHRDDLSCYLIGVSGMGDFSLLQFSGQARVTQRTATIKRGWRGSRAHPIHGCDGKPWTFTWAMAM